MSSEVELISIHRNEYMKEIISLFYTEKFSSYSVIKNIFSYQWDKKHSPDDDIIGYGIKRGTDLCGYIGCIKSKRFINGISYNFCNLSAAVVRPSYRRFSLRLFSTAISEADVILNLTPSPTVCNFLNTKYFGFKRLEDDVLCFNSKLLICDDKNVICIENIDEILFLIRNKELFMDIVNNNRYNARFILFIFDNKQLVVSFFINKVRNIKIAEIIYLSNKELFYDNYKIIINKICLSSQTIFCYCDSRYFIKTPICNLLNKTNKIFDYFYILTHSIVRIPRISLYKINNPLVSIDRLDIDALYTERVLVNNINRRCPR